MMFSFLVFSSVLQLGNLQNPSINTTALQPIMDIVTGHSKVFSRDTVRLKCVPPYTPYLSAWTYRWYIGPKRLSETGQQLVLSNVKTKDSGKYYCQGFRDTSVRDIPTFQSIPVEISVDGGWAILDTPSKGVVGYPMNMTCRVRGSPPVREVALFRDGGEVLKQNTIELFLRNVTLGDGGQYTCRASWDVKGLTHSVISTEVLIQVVEPLTQPTLIIVDDKEMRALGMLKLVCLTDYNVPAPAPPVLYYFYINGNRLGTPTSEKYTLIKRSRGMFSCNARVPQLGLSLRSDPESF